MHGVGSVQSIDLPIDDVEHNEAMIAAFKAKVRLRAGEAAARLEDGLGL